MKDSWKVSRKADLVKAIVGITYYEPSTGICTLLVFSFKPQNNYTKSRTSMTEENDQKQKTLCREVMGGKILLEEP